MIELSYKVRKEKLKEAYQVECSWNLKFFKKKETVRVV